MNQVLDWVRKNLAIVILVVVMIAAAVAIPMWASSRNAAVHDKVETRARLLSDINSLEKTPFENPVTGETQNRVINQALLRRYEEVVAAKREDAERVRAEAIEFNRDAHTLITPANWSESLGPWLFPAPPDMEREVRPKQFHELLVQAYRNLLNEINAGTPPEPGVLAEELEQKKSQFMLHNLSKTAEQSLTDDEQARLTDELREYRLGRYQEVASSIDLYAAIETLNVPQWNQQSIPDLAELFQWQWQYWIISDILRALSNANADAQSVLQAPVKRLLAINPTGAPSVSAGSGGTTGGGGMSAPGPGGALGGGSALGGSGQGRRPIPGGPGGGRSPSAPQQPQAGGGQAINPNTPAPVDYSVSFTGRTTNSLYDVRYVTLSIVADTRRLPEIIDALAAQNFITVLDLNLTPVDPFEDVREGYMYGTGTLSEVNMVLETIWLREWTSENMPADLKRSLGIPVQTQPQNPNPAGGP